MSKTILFSMLLLSGLFSYGNNKKPLQSDSDKQSLDSKTKMLVYEQANDKSLEQVSSVADPVFNNSELSKEYGYIWAYTDCYKKVRDSSGDVVGRDYLWRGKNCGAYFNRSCGADQTRCRRLGGTATIGIIQ